MVNRDITIKKPKWIKMGIPSGENVNAIRKSLRENGLYTVCEEAKCPNMSECWEDRTATLMILGDTCTRACKFCNVKTGNPQGVVNQDEIKNSINTVGLMKLRYVVLTSVDRDDLPDFGAGHFAAVVKGIRGQFPETKVEVLIPDFNIEETYMHTLAQSRPFVIAQNVETVNRLTHPVRDRRAGYEKTLKALEFYKNNYPDIPTKTSLMVGLGETITELEEAMKDIRDVGVNIITFGQYLQPSRNHLHVERFYPPEEFEMLKHKAYELGFDYVASGPMVRSSYKAAEYLDFLEEKYGSVRTNI